MKKNKVKISTILFGVAGVLSLLFLIGFTFGVQQAFVKVGEGPTSVTIGGISETAAIILFVLILISFLIGWYFKSKGR